MRYALVLAILERFYYQPPSPVQSHLPFSLVPGIIEHEATIIQPAASSNLVLVTEKTTITKWDGDLLDLRNIRQAFL